jgi:hypothetical protein
LALNQRRTGSGRHAGDPWHKVVLAAQASAKGRLMRVSGFLMVVATFVAMAMLEDTAIRVAGWGARDFALIVAAIISNHVGVVIWHRQAPATSEQSVKLGLGAVLAVTAVVFTLIWQAISGWLEYPEVVVPLTAIGCFVFPFAVVGSLWKALAKGKKPERKDTELDAPSNRLGE